jgi:YegS/Rv2252/BmrU family lipid kinase
VSATLIVNPSSGGGIAGARLTVFTDTLHELGIEHTVSVTQSIEHARELAAAAAAGGQLAVAVGGDGLVSAVAAGLISSAGTMAVLPGGRGNDFARALGIPRDPKEACQTLAAGKSIAVDIGRVGDRTFVGIATCGFDSEANRIANDARHVPHKLVYAYGGIRALSRWSPATFQLTLDGVQRELYGYNVAVANSAAYGSGMYIAPDARTDDGLFDVVMISDAPKLAYLSNLPKVFKGTHVELPVVEIVRAREVQISASRPFALYADGDPLAELPVSISMLPGAIKVIVP